MPRRKTHSSPVKRTGPLSIYALAKAAGRNYSNVYRDVGKLIEHDLIAKDAEGRVYVPWDEVILRLTLASVA